MTYRLRKIRDDGDIMVVGCGGTGGFVAEGICRLIRGTGHNLRLVDRDRVEAKNLCRQNFYRADLGRFKAQVLAERLAASYGVGVEYAICPLEELSLNHRGYLTIGCVDNPAARERLQWAGSQAFGSGRISYHRSGGGIEGECWYIDAGNGEHSGQVLIGNCLTKECGQAFRPDDGVCGKLPLPTVQQPGLLAPEAKSVRRAGCAERIAANEQSPVINQMMASLVVTFVHKLLAGNLTWMAAYIDLEAGNARFIDAMPEAVSRITGHSVKQLEYRPRKERARVSV